MALGPTEPLLVEDCTFTRFIRGWSLSANRPLDTDGTRSDIGAHDGINQALAVAQSELPEQLAL